jgi:hypothetical protein
LGGLDSQAGQQSNLHKWEKRLLFMRHLTAGDFATVKRQSLVLDTTLTPDEWLKQLEIECEIKSGAPQAQAG